MFHRDGRAVLCDFGLGRITSAHAAASALPGATSVRGGTVAYLAPELLAGSRRASTAASDVYALGCVGYCLLAGVPQPWHGIVPASDTAAMEVEARVCRSDRPPLSASALPEAHPALVAWVERCWAQDAAARPTALQAAEELRRMFPGVSDDAGGSGEYLGLVSSVAPHSEVHDEYARHSFVVSSHLRGVDSGVAAGAAAGGAGDGSAGRSYADRLHVVPRTPPDDSDLQAHDEMPLPAAATTGSEGLGCELPSEGSLH